MKDHLTRKAADWFNDIESWQSFVELSSLQLNIEKVWLDAATEKLRQHFTNHPCLGWRFQQWGANHDTWWFPEEFGPESVGIGFGWRYHLCLGVAHGNRIDQSALAAKLQQETYQPLVQAFGRRDQPEYGFALEQYGCFSFGSLLDRNLPAHELAWYAGNDVDSFVRQAAAKIEAFARDPKITGLLRRLNQELINELSAMK